MSNWSPFFPAKNSSYNPRLKQRGYLVPSENGGPLDTAEFMLTMPATSFNEYAGKMTYVCDRDEYYYYNTGGAWQPITKSGIDLTKQVYFDIGFDVSLAGKMLGSELKSSENYIVETDTFVFNDGDTFEINPRIVIDFNNKEVPIDIAAYDGFDVSSNPTNMNADISNGLAQQANPDSSGFLYIAKAGNTIKAGNVIFEVTFNNGTEDTSDDITITGKFHYAINPLVDSSEGQAGNTYYNIFCNPDSSLEGKKLYNFLFLHDNTTQLQKGFLVASQSGGALDVGTFIDGTKNDFINKLPVNIYPGKQLYSYADDKYYYYSYNYNSGKGANFEINFPEFSKYGISDNARIKDFYSLNPGIDTKDKTCGFIELKNNTNQVGDLSEFKINVVASSPVLAKNTRGDSWVLSFDGVASKPNTSNASGVIQPTGNDNGYTNIKSSGFNGEDTNYLDSSVTLSAKVTADIKVGANYYNIDLYSNDASWLWNGTDTSVQNVSTNEDFRNYTYKENDYTFYVKPSSTIPYFPDAKTQTVTTAVRPYYQQAILHFADSLQSLNSDWKDSDSITIDEKRYDDDTTPLYCHLLSTNRNYNRNDVNDLRYIVLASQTTESGFAVKTLSGANNPVVNYTTNTNTVNGQYHILQLPCGTPFKDGYKFNVYSAFTGLAGADNNNPLSYAGEDLTISLSDYAPKYSLKMYADASLTSEIQGYTFDAQAYTGDNKVLYIAVLDDNQKLQDKGRDASLAWTLDVSVLSNSNVDASLSNDRLMKLMYASFSDSPYTSRSATLSLDYKGEKDAENAETYNALTAGEASDVVFGIEVKVIDNFPNANLATANRTFNVTLVASKYQIQFRIADEADKTHTIWYNGTDMAGKLSGMEQWPLQSHTLASLVGNDSSADSSFIVESRVVVVDVTKNDNDRKPVEDSSISNFILIGNSVGDTSVILNRNEYQKSDIEKDFPIDASVTVKDTAGTYSIVAHSILSYNAYLPIVSRAYTGFESFIPVTNFSDASSGTLALRLLDSNDNNLLDKEFSDGYILTYAWSVPNDSSDIITVNSKTADTSIFNVTVKPNMSPNERTIETDVFSNVYRYSTSGALLWSGNTAITYKLAPGEKIMDVSLANSTLNPASSGMTKRYDLFCTQNTKLTIKAIVSGINLLGDTIFESTAGLTQTDVTVEQGNKVATYTFTVVPFTSAVLHLKIKSIYANNINSIPDLTINVLVISADSITIDSSYAGHDNKVRHIINNSNNTIKSSFNYVNSGNITLPVIDLNGLLSSLKDNAGTSYTGTFINNNVLTIPKITSSDYQKQFNLNAVMKSNDSNATASTLKLSSETIQFVKPTVNILTPTSSPIFTDVSYNVSMNALEYTSITANTNVTGNIGTSLIKWTVPQYGNVTGSSFPVKFTKAYGKQDFLLETTFYTKGTNPTLADYIIDSSRTYNIENIAASADSSYAIRTKVGDSYTGTGYTDIEYISDYIEVQTTVKLNADFSNVDNISAMLQIGAGDGTTVFTPNVSGWVGNSDASYMFEKAPAQNGNDTKSVIYTTLIFTNHSALKTGTNLTFAVKILNALFTNNLTIPVSFKELISSTQSLSLPMFTDGTFTSTITVKTTPNVLISDMKVLQISGGQYDTTTKTISTIKDITVKSMDPVGSQPTFTVTAVFNKAVENSQTAQNHQIVSPSNLFNGWFGIKLDLMDRGSKTIIQSSTISSAMYSIKMKPIDPASIKIHQLEFDKDVYPVSINDQVINIGQIQDNIITNGLIVNLDAMDNTGNKLHDTDVLALGGWVNKVDKTLQQIYKESKKIVIVPTAPTAPANDASYTPPILENTYLDFQHNGFLLKDANNEFYLHGLTDYTIGITGYFNIMPDTGGNFARILLDVGTYHTGLMAVELSEIDDNNILPISNFRDTSGNWWSQSSLPTSDSNFNVDLYNTIYITKQPNKYSVYINKKGSVYSANIVNNIGSYPVPTISEIVSSGLPYDTSNNLGTLFSDTQLSGNSTMIMRINRLAIYNRVLTDDEIYQNMVEDVSRFGLNINLQ